MSELEEALWLSAKKWVNSFPNDLPKHKFSKKHNKIINDIICNNHDKKIIKFSKNTIKILLIAAVLLAIATTVFAIPSSREAITDKFFNHSEYNVIDTSGAKKVTSLKLNYIPTGFKICEESNSNDFRIKNYNNDDEYFYVKKYTIDTSIYFDTEKHDSKNIKINGMDAVYYMSDNELKGIMFNDGEYIFVVSGNISKDELVKIAQNVE